MAPPKGFARQVADARKLDHARGCESALRGTRKRSDIAYRVPFFRPLSIKKEGEVVIVTE